MEVVVLCVALVGLAAYVAAPLYRPPRDEGAPAPGAEAEQHRAVVEALRELEIDHASGLIDAAELGQQRSVLEAKAASQVARRNVNS